MANLLQTVSNIFNPQPAQPVAPATPGNIPASPSVSSAPATTGSDPNGVVPGTATQAPAAPKDNSPLAPFADLWQNTTNKSGESIDPNASLKLNPEDVMKAAAKIDFSGTFTPENLDAISAGGEGAQRAFVESLTAVARQVLTQSTLVNSQLANEAIVRAIAATEAKIPALLRDASASDHLNTTNPIFQNPAIQPVVEATKQQLLGKYPNATPAQITEMTRDYIMAMGEAFAPKPVDINKGSTNWEAFLQN